MKNRSIIIWFWLIPLLALATHKCHATTPDTVYLGEAFSVSFPVPSQVLRPFPTSPIGCAMEMPEFIGGGPYGAGCAYNEWTATATMALSLSGQSTEPPLLPYAVSGACRFRLKTGGTHGEPFSFILMPERPLSIASRKFGPTPKIKHTQRTINGRFSKW